MPISSIHHSVASALVFVTTLGLLPSGVAHAETTALLSATSQGKPGNGISDHPSISADGRYVAFQSVATNLVSSDTNSTFNDIFLLDRQSGSMSRVSKGLLGAESNSGSQTAAISGAGRFIAFESTATNLVSGDTNLEQDVFVYDATLGTTVRISVSTGGTAGNAASFKPQLSSNGRYIAFMSYATTLVSGDTNGFSDVFLHDRDPDGNSSYDEGNGTTVRASVGTAGAQLAAASDFPSISADGNFVAFASGNSVYVYDRVNGTTQNTNPASNASSTFTSLSADGRYVAHSSTATNLVTGDTNAVEDVFVYDRTLTTTVRASMSQSGAQSTYASKSPAISADGRYVAFVTEAGTLNTRVSPAGVIFDAISAATGGGGGSGSGTTTTYYVYRRDLSSGTTVRAGSTYSGSVPNASSGNAVINGDGTLITFASSASNLTCTTDSNAVTDVYLRDLRSTTATPSCSTQTATTTSAGGSLELPFVLLLALNLALRRRATR